MESNVEHSHLPVSHQFLGWLDKNRQPVLTGVTVAAVAGLVVWFIINRHNEKEAAASAALSSVVAGQGMGPGAAGRADAYLKVAKDHAGSAAAVRAELLAAGSLFSEGKFAQAQELFQKFTRDHRDSPLMGEALLGVAAAQDAQGKAQDAITSYKQLVERHPAENVIPQAKFALARLYEAQNKPELARPLFEDVARNNPYGSLGSEAGMRLEELNKKFPPPAPPVTPVAPAVTAVSATNARAVTPALVTNAPVNIQKK